MPQCRHCGDELPKDCPPEVTSCRGYADWEARTRGDMLPAWRARDLMLFRWCCEATVAS